MTPEELLKALAESDRQLEAPSLVEAKLQAAFRQKHQHPIRKRMWIWIPMAAAAAIAAMVTLMLMNRPKPHQNPVVVQAPVQSAPQVLRDPRSDPATATVRPVAHRRMAQPREVVTDFFPLVEDAPQVSDGAELVRVNLPASAMRDVGLPVREDRLNDRVQADVLVNYGMATAVRFVSYQK